MLAAGVEDMDEGYGTPDEDQTTNLTPAKMTVNAIKDWLTEQGHENVVWDLSQAKAKKPRWVWATLTSSDSHTPLKSR